MKKKWAGNWEPEIMEREVVDSQEDDRKESHDFFIFPTQADRTDSFFMWYWDVQQ